MADGTVVWCPDCPGETYRLEFAKKLQNSTSLSPYKLFARYKTTNLICKVTFQLELLWPFKIHTATLSEKLKKIMHFEVLSRSTHSQQSSIYLHSQHQHQRKQQRVIYIQGKCSANSKHTEELTASSQLC